MNLRAFSFFAHAVSNSGENSAFFQERFNRIYSNGNSYLKGIRKVSTLKARTGGGTTDR